MISVIVPVYNAAKYLEGCVNSILSQTYSDFEIVLVDDGSSDDSPKLCDKWAMEDDRIQVIHKPNGGVSSARNIGLSEAKGEYVLFLDSDDKLKCDALTLLMSRMNESVSIVMGGFEYVYSDHIKATTLDFEGIYTKEEFLREYLHILYYSRILFAPANKLYKKALIETNNIRFDEDMPINEDILFALDCLEVSEKIGVVDSVIYEYLQTNTGSALSRYQPKFIESTVIYLNRITDLFPKSEKTELVSGHVMRALRQEYRLSDISAEIAKDRFSVLRECVKDMSASDILFAKGVNKDAKLVCLLLRLKLYDALYKYGLKKVKKNAI